MKLLLNKNQFVYNISLYQVGYEKCDKHHSFGPVIRDFYLIHFVVNGRGFLEHKGETIPLEKGDLFLIPTNEIIRYYALESDPYEYYWVGFYGVNASEVLKEIGYLNGGNLILKAGDRFAEIYEIFKKMCSNNDEKSLKENLSMLGQFYSLLGLMAPEGVEYNPPDDVETARNKLTRYIDFNYNVNISMKMLEKVGNMHRSSIFRLFKKSYGLSPSEYLAEYRMDRALHLLKNTDYSIKKIASLVGYENSAYFCKAFKKKYLKTPSEARKLT